MVDVSARRHFDGKIVGFRTNSEPFRANSNYSVTPTLIKQKQSISGTAKVHCCDHIAKTDTKNKD